MAIKKIVKKILNVFLGKKMLQGLYETLFNISLRGMNYGTGANFKESGELSVMNYINKRFNSEKSLIIFDVGGNYGNYAKVLANFFKTKVIIHSFEPSKKTYDIFLKTTKDIKNLVSNNFGLSDTENYQILYTNEEGSGLASIYQRKLDHFGISMDKTEEIKLTTLDGYCKENGIDHINFLKLDIEGNELKALLGAKQMITNKKIDIIQFEFGGCNIDSRTYFQDFYYLLKDNYQLYRILKNGLYEILTYKESYEIFITTNYLAVIK
jgi:FkbM family methyltransferase